MNRLAQAFIIFLLVLSIAWPFGASAAEGDVPTLKQIMADPSWFARSPESAAWLADGSGIVFEQRRPGVLGRDTSDRLVLMLDGVTAAGWPRMLEEAELANVFAARGDWSADRSRLVVSRGGDLFLWRRDESRWTQLTRTTDGEGSARFMADGSIAFLRGGDWFVREESGLEREAADIRFEEDPATKEDPELDDLAQSQRDLFVVFQEKAKRDELNETTERSRRDADRTRTPGPFYLDPKQRERGAWLSPSGRGMLVATGPERPASERTDQMPRYVTESGFVETQRLRAKVADGRRDPVGFVLLDLETEKAHELKFDDLPMIRDDPLAEIKAAAEARAKKDDSAGDSADDGDDTDDDAKSKEAKPGKVRPVSSLGARWSDSGRSGAVMLRSNDNKDRWLVVVDADADEPAWRVVHHTRDPAWISWEFNGFGFVPGTESLWFQSEHDGWGHVYLADLDSANDAAFRALTSGPWEVREVTPAHDASGFWVRTNRTDNGIYEIERVAMDGTLTPITALGGAVESFEMSPDESRILFTWSGTMDPPELYAVAADGSAGPARLTKTDTALYRSFDFTEPEFVRVPSSHAEGEIHMRVYRPDPERFPGPRPMVVFAHGAGYLQFAYRGWSNYFREHMFHTLLTERGIMVLGPDFRHSEGYGRDWRVAVYRDMGEPELRDFDDCLAYAAAELGGDPERVGIYGGSYGGFLTLMGLFLRPDVYDAGAALRSVADWRQYSFGWTGNILDTPQVDPEPFDRSSPITHAAGLKGALLMCHGLVDDNVVAQDVIRLSQRLIELEKTDWELALYPVEPHGFVEPSSWLDEYRRILELFEEHLLE